MTKISKTCEVVTKWGRDALDTPTEFCGAPTAWWYPAQGGGTMALCEAHSVPHQNYAHRYEAVNNGPV